MQKFADGERLLIVRIFNWMKLVRLWVLRSVNSKEGRVRYVVQVARFHIFLFSQMKV